MSVNTSLKDKIAGIRQAFSGKADANIRAFGGGFIFIVVLLIAIIALFLDIVFVTMIWDALPEGFLRLVAAGGAILVSPVILLILLAKLFYFRKGGQLIFSFVAFGIDILFAVLNTYCAFQIAWHVENAFVVNWRNLSPVTPVVIMVMLAILLILDPNADRRNKVREHQEKEQDLQLQFEYEQKEREFALKSLDAELRAAQQEAAIEVKTLALEEYKKHLAQEVLGPEAIAHLQEAARLLRIETLHSLTGLPRTTTGFPQLPFASGTSVQDRQNEQIPGRETGEQILYRQFLDWKGQQRPDAGPFQQAHLDTQANQMSSQNNGHRNSTH